jgi:hypothetical protein
MEIDESNWQTNVAEPNEPKKKTEEIFLGALEIGTLRLCDGGFNYSN